MPLEGFIPNGSDNPGKTGGHTEFGGGKPGRSGPQRLPDGSSKGLKVGESARVLRALGVRRSVADTGAGRPTAQPGTLEYVQQLEAFNRAQELSRRTNGYANEISTDENVSDA